MSIIHDALTKKESKRPARPLVSSQSESAANFSLGVKRSDLPFLVLSIILLVCLIGLAVYAIVIQGRPRETILIQSVPSANLKSETPSQETVSSASSPEFTPRYEGEIEGWPASYPGESRSLQERPSYFDVVLDESFLEGLNSSPLPPPADKKLAETPIPSKKSVLSTADLARKQNQQKLLDEAAEAYQNLDFELYETKLMDCISLKPVSPEGKQAAALLESYQTEKSTLTIIEAGKAAYDGLLKVSSPGREGSRSPSDQTFGTGDLLTAIKKTRLLFSYAVVDMEEASQVKVARLDCLKQANETGECVDLRVERGRVTALVQPQPSGSSLIISTKDARITTFSGRFSVAMEAENTEIITLHSGSAEVKLAGGKSRSLKQGESLVLRNGVVQD